MTYEDLQVATKQSQNVALHQAIAKGNIETVKLLLEEGGDIYSRHVRGSTTVHTAVCHRRLNVLKLLLSKDGRLINKTDSTGDTPINIAAAKGHESVLVYLLDAGADYTIRNKYGNTPFHSAAQRKRLRALKTLIHFDTTMIDDVNREGNTPLHIAAKKGYNEIIEMLLTKKAKYQKKNYANRNPMQLSTPSTLKVFQKYRECNDILQRCMNGMASLYATKRYEDGNTALHVVSSFGGHPEVINRLISGGAHVNAYNCLNQTPLFLAVLTDNIENVRALVSLGGRPDDPDERGQTALHLAAMSHDLKILKAITRRQSDVNVVDKDGKTPLSYAVVHQSRAAVQHLLRLGADVTLKDHQGQTALHLSVLTNNSEITKDLLSVVNTTTVNEQNLDGETPLMFAVDRRSLTFDENTIKMVDILIQKGADPYQRNNSGTSAYSLAAEHGFDISKHYCV